MTRELVLVHGSGQHGKDADLLKREWLEALAFGLAQHKPPLPAINASRVRFPFYGDTLDQMTRRRVSAIDAAEVLIRGETPVDSGEQRFMLEVLDEIRSKNNVTDADVQACAGETIVERGPLNWKWVRAVLQTLDTLPWLSATVIEQSTRDVYQYLTNGVVRSRIDSGVMHAMTPGTESVVVGHSLGSVVAYGLLQREGQRRGWAVPLFVTVGSPLAVTAIRTRVPGIGGVGGNRTPACVSIWFNAMDMRDAVALYPLDPQHFPINPQKPEIENKTDIDNRTSNRHGIAGYLEDPVVAKRIFDALNA